MKLRLLLILSLLLSACNLTSHPVKISKLGSAVTSSEMLRFESNIVDLKFEKVLASNWQFPREEVLNLKHPKAINAGLKEGLESLQLYFYVIDHPQHGRFLIDTGVSQNISSGKDSIIPAIVRDNLHLDKLTDITTTAKWLEPMDEVVQGIFLSHLHLDHLLGLPDLPQSSNLYLGPGEAGALSVNNIPLRPVFDSLFKGRPALTELAFTKKDNNPAIIDFFDDGSFYILSVPGHTPGSLAFFIRTLEGDHLIVGDTCHTKWGWVNGVTPGISTNNQELNQQQLDWFINLAKENTNIKVHLGHQEL